MKRIGGMGLFLVLSLSLAMPAFSQRGGGGGGGGIGGEDTAYQRIQDETNLQNRLTLIEGFTKQYTNSGYRPALDIQQEQLYIQFKRFSDAILKAESFHIDVP